MLYNELQDYVSKLDEEILAIKNVDKDAFIADEIAAFDAKADAEKEKFFQEQAGKRMAFVEALEASCDKDQSEAIAELEAEKAGLLITLKKLAPVEAEPVEEEVEESVEEAVEEPEENAEVEAPVEEALATAAPVAPSLSALPKLS